MSLNLAKPDEDYKTRRDLQYAYSFRVHFMEQARFWPISKKQSGEQVEGKWQGAETYSTVEASAMGDDTIKLAEALLYFLATDCRKEPRRFLEAGLRASDAAW